MIGNVVLGLLSAIASAIDSVIPHVPWPSFLDGSDPLGGIATFFGGLFRPLVPYVPIDLWLTIIHDGFLFLPAVAGWVVFEWVWRHVTDLIP